MKQVDLRVPLVAALLLVALVAACTESSPDAQTSGVAATARADDADTQAAAVTEQSLLANERYWPYRVALAEPFRVDGREQPLPAGVTGVLIRVEASGTPLVDFGSHGRYELPVGATDLLARANAIRRGESQKTEPIFVYAIQSRMLDSGAEALQALPLEASTGRAGFLCVFADPKAAEFEALARTLAPLRERAGVMTILFPQGEHANLDVRELLRALDWPVPFLLDHLAEPYTKTLLPEASTLPFVLLQSPEGRVLFQGPPAPDDAAFLAALDAAFEDLARSRSLADSSS